MDRRMSLLAALSALTLVLAGCGDDPDSGSGRDAAADGSTTSTEAPPASTPEPAPATTAAPASAAQLARLAKRPAGAAGLVVPAVRARIVAERSEFGNVLFDANGQVVYAFENDEPSQSNCTSDDCVKAWPPVLTKQAPTAGTGVTGSKLGTIKRDDGSLQVTYHGRPLYFYEHEAPGEIKCHNVDLHGGTWWVVTPSGANAA